MSAGAQPHAKEEEFLLIQLSDPHLRPPGRLFSGCVDVEKRLLRTLESITGLSPKPRALILTGDLADRGEPEAYRLLRELLSSLPFPSFLLPGNHDRRTPLREIFPDQPWSTTAADGRLCYAVELDPFRLIVLDTLIEERPEGRVGTAQLAWLEEQLEAGDDRPILLAMHHPPLAAGIPHMDRMACLDGPSLLHLLRRHGNVARILCGHLHRPAHLFWNGIPVTIAPACSFHLDSAMFDARAESRYVLEPPGFLVHRRVAGTGLVSHAMTVGSFEGPCRFDYDTP